MATLSAPATVHTVRRTALFDRLHPHEYVVMLFFLVLAVVAWDRAVPVVHVSGLSAIALAVGSLCVAESTWSAPWSRVTRQFAFLALVLVAYRSLDLVPFVPSRLPETWIVWDRALLHDLGLQRAVEWAGPAGPWLLETAYLLLYSMPPTALLLVWICGRKRRVNQLLFVLFGGTCAVYLLLPIFGVPGPRIMFPDADLPQFTTWPRTVNVWLLDHYDSKTGVFPSGHCGVAFSCAFGLLRAMPERKWIWGGTFLMASLVYLATVYGRYHYAVDGLASMAIAASVWAIAAWTDRQSA